MFASVQDFFKEYAEAADQEWGKTKISIMVFGPNTEERKLGSQLRKYIIEKCKETNVVVRTEHEDFINIHRNIFSTNRNICHMEIKAAEHVDAIIMLPDSAGSLVELGMFVPLTGVHNKIMIFFNDKHSVCDEKPNFIYLGPKLVYKENRVPVEFVNFRSKKIIWEKVKSFLHEKKSRKYENSIVRRLVS